MIEALLLTGGRSSRMGEDKASLWLDGEQMGPRMVRLLKSAGLSVTVLGRSPIEGAAFLADSLEYAGPVEALRGFEPKAEFVFVASCDLPRFDPRIVQFLASQIGQGLAATPRVDGFLQPLCALYRAGAFARLNEPLDCPMAWLKALDPVVCDEDWLRSQDIDPASIRGANTKAELAEVLGVP